MNKQEFLSRLRASLSDLPREEQEEQLTFYREMIEDRVEEGMTEEEAVAQIGPLPAVPPKPKGSRSVGATVLLILGSPVWLSLVVAAAAVVLALYVSAWAVVIALWAVGAALAVSAVAGLAAGVALCFSEQWVSALALVGAAITCAGLAILLLLGCKAATRGMVWLTGKLARWLKGCFRKEDTV